MPSTCEHLVRKAQLPVSEVFNMYIGSLLYRVPGSLLWAYVLQSTGEDVVTLYHYTDELAFRNVGNLEQTAAQLFASLTDERAHFGKGSMPRRMSPPILGWK